MSPGALFGAAVVAGLAWINMAATRRIRASDLDAWRKKLFIAGVWLMPFFGALAVKDIGAPRSGPRAEPDSTAEPAPSFVLLHAGQRFDMQAHLSLGSGVPVLDWEAARAAARDASGSVPAPAMLAIYRAWLLHLRDTMGPHFQLRESEDAIVLSSLDDAMAAALLRYVTSARTRIGRLLRDIAQFRAGEKSIVLVLDDEESYYRYIATYYPDGGEFGFSGGIFLEAGCPHFVVKRGELHAVEPVIAHELTHSAVSHLDLPLWVDEGLAVNTERAVSPPAGVLHANHTPAQLHAKHVAFWTPNSIQEFWSGDAFHRPDDGQLLSYELARILVEQISADWAAFARFVHQADRDDAGVAAAREALGIDLVASVCALFGKQATAQWLPQPDTAVGAA